MTYREQALVFACEGEQLLGIISSPAQGVAASGIGVVIIVGGPQYRAGSHRQFVQTARSLAKIGHIALRFDYRGMGDSNGVQRDFLAVEQDIDAAITALLAQYPGLQDVVLWGLCDGASAALLYLHASRDARLAGLCLLNPWVRSEASLARTHVKHYYLQRLMQKTFWSKLLSGGVGLMALRGLARNIRRALAGTQDDAVACHTFQERMALAWRRFEGPILLLISQNDLTAQEFLDQVTSSPSWHLALTRPQLSIHHLPNADHTLSDTSALAEANGLLLEWLHSFPNSCGNTRKAQRP